MQIFKIWRLGIRDNMIEKLPRPSVSRDSIFYLGETQYVAVKVRTYRVLLDFVSYSNLGDCRAAGVAHRVDDRRQLGARADGGRRGLQFLEGIGGVAFCDGIEGVRFLDTLVAGTPFADGGIAGIGKQVAAIGISDEAFGEQALNDFRAGAAAQIGRQRFNVAIGTSGGSLENDDLGFSQFGLGSHGDLRFLVGVVTRRGRRSPATRPPPASTRPRSPTWPQ